MAVAALEPALEPAARPGNAGAPSLAWKQAGASAAKFAPWGELTRRCWRPPTWTRGRGWTALPAAVSRTARHRARPPAPPWRADQLTDTSALVHECWLRLQRASRCVSRQRGPFLALAASVMRSTIIDLVRQARRNATRWWRTACDAGHHAGGRTGRQAHRGAGAGRALNDLARLDARSAQVVKCASTPACPKRRWPRRWGYRSAPCAATGNAPAFLALALQR